MKLLFLILVFSVAAFGEAPVFSKRGADDFKTLALSGKIVDKTLLIKDLIDRNELVTLITRPRRWGKSTSVSMLWRFFALEQDQNEAKQNRELFKTFKIKNATTQDPITGRQVNIIERFQGKCPSISLSFKDVRAETFEKLIEKLKTVISTEFRRHKYLAQELGKKSRDIAIDEYDRKLAQSDLSKFERLSLDEGDAASTEDLGSSLVFLSQLLYEYHNKTKVCVFFDEYDAPLHMAFKKDYLEPATELIRAVFGPLLKGNDRILERGVLTGILRLTRADLLSGMNNIDEDNVFNAKYASHYGFTEAELDELFIVFELERTDKDKFQKTYNGYKFYRGQNESSKVAIYNPWSVVSYLKNNALLDNYWSDTGGTELLDQLVVHPNVQDNLATLRSGKSIHMTIPKDVTFSSLTDNSETLWPLLVHAGYLTLANAPIFYNALKQYEVDLVIPNTEVQSAYSGFHNQWLKNNQLPSLNGIAHFNDLIAFIVARDSEKVSAWIKEKGRLIDFTTTKWKIDPLQLAALSGDAEIFSALYEQYPALHNSIDSEGLNIGDYLQLSGLKITPSIEPLFFKEAVPLLEPLCYGAAYTEPLLSPVIVGGGSCFLAYKTKHWAITGSAIIVVGSLVHFYKDLAAPLIKKLFGLTCERYNRLHKVTRENFSTLLQFGEYVARNKGSYVSLAACRNGDIVISKFEKAATDVKYVEIKPLTFFLCQSQPKQEL